MNTPASTKVEQHRLAVAKAIASKTYAFANMPEEGSDQYDCGEWEEMGDLAHATYLDAADAVLALTPAPSGEGREDLVLVPRAKLERLAERDDWTGDLAGEMLWDARRAAAPHKDTSHD